MPKDNSTSSTSLVKCRHQCQSNIDCIAYAYDMESKNCSLIFKIQNTTEIPQETTEKFEKDFPNWNDYPKCEKTRKHHDWPNRSFSRLHDITFVTFILILKVSISKLFIRLR